MANAKNIEENDCTPDGDDRQAPPRHARLPQFIGGPQDAGSRLGGLKVALIGCGSVGWNLALHLARLHVSSILLVDPARVKRESLLTHPAVPENISKPKASVLAGLCRRISPETTICSFVGPVEKLALIALDRFDAVLLATDNLLAEIEVGQRCRRLGVPLLQASVHGDTLVAQVRHFSNRGADAPCPACGFSAAEWSALNRETRFSCQGSGTGETEPRIDGPPTMSLSFLCSLAADLAMNHVVRSALGLGKPGEDFLLEYCCYTDRTHVSPLARNPHCVGDHTPCRRIRLPRPVPSYTLRQLASEAGFNAKSARERVSFQVDRLVFAEYGACGCEDDHPLRRFQLRGNGAGRCGACGKDISVQPFFTHDTVSCSILAGEMNRPLQEIGAASARWAVVRGRRENALFLSEGTERWKS